jgi:hypothetical protein
MGEPSLATQVSVKPHIARTAKIALPIVIDGPRIQQKFNTSGNDVGVVSDKARGSS